MCLYVFICIYMYICVCVYIYMYMYVYIYMYANLNPRTKNQALDLLTKLLVFNPSKRLSAAEVDHYDNKTMTIIISS